MQKNIKNETIINFSPLFFSYKEKKIIANIGQIKLASNLPFKYFFGEKKNSSVFSTACRKTEHPPHPRKIPPISKTDSLDKSPSESKRNPQEISKAPPTAERSRSPNGIPTADNVSKSAVPTKEKNTCWNFD